MKDLGKAGRRSRRKDHFGSVCVQPEFLVRADGLDERAQEHAHRLGIVLPSKQVQCLLAVPLPLGDEIIGVLSLYSVDRERAFDEAHVRQLTTLAAYIAVKIRNAELLEQAERRAEELGFLFDITRTAVSTTDLCEALAGVADVMLHEVRGSEALDLLKAWGTGHPGGVGTIHAGTAIGALRRLEQLIQEAVVTVPRALIAETIDLVAVLSGRGNARRLAELARIEGLGPDGDYRVTAIQQPDQGDPS